jgi:hypothetical protein
MSEPQIQRMEHALKGLTIGTVQSMNDAADRAAKDGLIERDEQWQIEITGTAEEFFNWSIAIVKFGTVFSNATGQRDSELEQPHFTYGASIITATPVGVLASVMEWTENERKETVGCKLAIGVAATDRHTKFRGFLHANFQGYGQPGNTFMPEDLGGG